jgi:predicted 2-oxoglutarate/Fe(II)-dependent dioxygenase YbiX
MPSPGEPAPWFVARPRSHPEFDFSQVAGRHAVLCFIGSLPAPAVLTLVEVLRRRQDLFDGEFASLFIVAGRPAGVGLASLTESPSVLVLGDEDGSVAQLYGLRPSNAVEGTAIAPTSFVLDPMLRVIQSIPIGDAALHADEILTVISAQPRLESRPAAPVLLLPRVFEPVLCDELVALFQRTAGQDTGFMRNDPVTGRSLQINDHAIKRRRDCIIEDQTMLRAVLERLSQRLVPEIRKVFQFEVTRVERCIVSCYDSCDGGHFRIHRDNTSKATAHRRFAVTINLNTGGYDGGDLVFPEFGAGLWSPPTGAALVFSCSLLHEVRPVTQGARYCFLPFLFDEAAEDIRLQNHKFLQDTQGAGLRNAAQKSDHGQW